MSFSFRLSRYLSTSKNILKQYFSVVSSHPNGEVPCLRIHSSHPLHSFLIRETKFIREYKKLFSSGLIALSLSFYRNTLSFGVVHKIISSSELRPSPHCQVWLYYHKSRVTFGTNLKFKKTKGSKTFLRRI